MARTGQTWTFQSTPDYSGETATWATPASLRWWRPDEHTTPVLQQAWVCFESGVVEWRPVEMVTGG